jgi:hydrogenase nickel incorporation protein HypB
MCQDSACAHSAALAAAPSRHLPLGQRLLARNGELAAANRERFSAAGVRVINLLSSPGAGKTALLEALARRPAATAGPAPRLAVVVGDLATDNDARRLRAAGLPAAAVTTGQACHLEAAMVWHGVEALAAGGVALADLDWLVLENVGNLVCPAAYDLGESLRLVLLSVAEGEDKPLKYPALFHSADVVAITKTDLLAATGFDLAQAREAIARVAPRAAVVELSARSGEGLERLWAALG